MGTLDLFGFNDNAARQEDARLVNNVVNGIYPDPGKNIDVNGIKIAYRLGQRKLIRQILSAIRDNQILIVQAGVGVGKSFGYLIPILAYKKNGSAVLKQAIISTSTIVLQEQLINDIKTVETMLGIPHLNVAIAKGVNNYACLNRIIRASNSIHTSPVKKKILDRVLDEIGKKNSIDKDKLSHIAAEVWDLIKLKSRSYCVGCSYRSSCQYSAISKQINHADIIITNHNQLAASVLDDREYVQDADMIVIDEAHKFESAIRDVQSRYLEYDNIRNLLLLFADKYSGYDSRLAVQCQLTMDSISTFFSSVTRRGSGYFYKNQSSQKIEIVDSDKIPFSVEKIEHQLVDVINNLKKFIILVNNLLEYGIRERETKEKLDELLSTFEDMLKKDKSKNIYWADYLKKNSIRIGYTDKTTRKVTDRIFGKIPVVCTSGTLLDANGSYQYFKDGLSLRNSLPQQIVEGEVCPSPFDYSSNSWFYYDAEIANPRDDHETYLEQLVVKIPELLKVTHGRALVLFTSKKDMEYVYQRIDKSQFDFDVMMQGQDNLSNQELQKIFKKKTKSCLFATGAFWEGIDIKGRSLSNVIITRLPFENVDAITLAKEERYTANSFEMVYLNNMVQKFAQGIGRLIRGNRDKGIVCCLDSRFLTYAEAIQRVIPYTRFTDNFDDIKDFSSQCITQYDGKRGPYKKRILKTEDKNTQQ